MKSLAILVVLALLWGVGLLAFADRVARFGAPVLHLSEGRLAHA